MLYFGEIIEQDALMLNKLLILDNKGGWYGKTEKTT
jgi:hypothetical protein